MGTDTTKVIIFDCDGVLFDSKEANIAFYNQILSQFNLPPLTIAEVEYVHVSTAEEALRYLFLLQPVSEQDLPKRKEQNLYYQEPQRAGSPPQRAKQARSMIPSKKKRHH